MSKTIKHASYPTSDGWLAIALYHLSLVEFTTEKLGKGLISSRMAHFISKVVIT